jgi:lipoprotein-anchoring transpeptidase ErfK/SrfK
MYQFLSSLTGIVVILLFIGSSQAQAADVFTKEKLITVDTTNQVLKAWDDGHVVYTSAASTGLPFSPTVHGSFRIYAKVPLQRMIGVSPYHGRYDLPNVPNNMYFYQGYAIHGAYWHDNFGHPMSNGCVNLPLYAAKWMYNWAPVGTRVEVY